MPCPDRIEIVAKADQSAEILIYDRIGQSFWEEGVTAKQFRADLKALGDVKTLHVRINSPGGSVTQGVAIYEALKDHAAKKVGHIDGIAASMASVIAMACDEIEIAEAGFVMIHDPYGAFEGKAEDLRRFADMMDKSKERMAGIYSARTNLSVEEVGRMMAAETWMDSEEAVAKGFANKVSGKADVTAEVRLDGFRNVPQRVRDLYGQAKPRGKKEESKSMADDNKGPVAATLAELKANCEGADSDFLLAQLEKGATVLDAVKAHNAKLKADADAAKADLAKAKAGKPDPQGQKPGVDPVGDAGGKPQDDEQDPHDTVERLVAERMAAANCDHPSAWRYVMEKRPELRESLVASANRRS